MRKLLALLGLVLIPLGFGNMALAQSGSDSSGTHSYNLECVGEDLIVANTGSGRIQFLYSLASAQPVIFLDAGESRNLGTPGEDTGPPGTGFEVGFEEPVGSGFYYGLDAGGFPDCIDTPEEPEDPTYSATGQIVCEGPQIRVNNTGTGHFLVWEEMTLTYQQVFAGQSGLIPWETGDDGNLVDPMNWVARYTSGGGSATAGYGSFTVAQYHAQCDNVVPPEEDEAPSLLNECRGADWYLVHPDESPATTFAYRLGNPFTGEVLYDGNYTSNNPDAVYGEILVPAGTDEVGYADDFNEVHTNTRPEACGGPATPTTPTEPPTTGPAGSVIRNLSVLAGGGFVAAGSEIGPGAATFGAAGFGPGEQVTVTLHSTPRGLGTVTADASGNVSITFEVLASDGAGEHRVEFTGPSGTVSVPFTLVLPAASLPETR